MLEIHILAMMILITKLYIIKVILQQINKKNARKLKYAQNNLQNQKNVLYFCALKYTT